MVAGAGHYALLLRLELQLRDRWCKKEERVMTYMTYTKKPGISLIS